MNDKEFKLIVLNKIAFELYNGIKDHNEIGVERMKEIKSLINTSFEKGRKFHNLVMRSANDKKTFDYVKHVIYRLVLLLRYLELPYDGVIEKFILASKKDEKAIYDYLVLCLEKYGEVKGMNPEDDLDTYSILLHVLDALGLKTTNPLIQVKSMKFIRKHEIHDLANVCGVFEAYSQSQEETMNVINNILNSYRYEKNSVQS